MTVVSAVRGTWERWVPATVSDELLAEITDPVSFVVGAFIIAFSPSRDPWAEERVGAAITVCVAAATPPVLGAIFAGVGDPLAYALTTFGASVVTIVPARVDDLRKQGRLPGSGYPRT